MRLVPDFTSYTASARPGCRLPVTHERPLGVASPTGIYAALRSAFGRAMLLESGKSGRYSFIGLPEGRPLASAGRSVSLPDGRTVETDPFDALRELLAGERVIGDPVPGGFCGGLVGYLGYDMARHVERLPTIATADPPIPDSLFLLVQTFVVVDHDRSTLTVIASLRCDDEPGETYEECRQRIAAVLDAIEAHVDDDVAVRAAGTPEVTPNLTQQEFEAIVARAKEYIRAGDIFQVNLSVRFAQRYDADALALYRTLRSINPAPYMALMELPELAIVSASPELLVRVRGRVVETRPIAGTRPRGATEEEDEINARKLAANEKERAEHLMLVDLERNDLGRVSRYGSVRVEEFMGIERYSHVIHIVSHVRGELADGRDTVDAIRACFPGGTITGAPKVRSMEIIEELEPHRRGIYTGSIGWIGFDGSAELNIAIRTIVVVEGVAYAQAGAGIVADSVPEHEYRESLRKAQAALDALGGAGA